MTFTYPSKQTLVILVVCVIAVGAAWLYVDAQSGASKSAPAPTITADDSASVSLQISTSTDWRKQFIDTSSSSSVTGSTSSKASTGSSDENLTLTDQFGREVFEKYTELKQAGLASNPSVVQATGNELANSSVFTSMAPQTYAAKDIKIIPNVDAASVRQYINLVAVIFSTAPTSNEAEIALGSLNSGDTSGLKQIDPNIASYTQIIASLRALPVPQSLVSAHLNIVNGFSTALFSSQNLRVSDVDPVRGIIGIRTYLAAADIIHTGVEALRDAVVSLNISYSPTEPAYSFLNPPDYSSTYTQ